MAKQAATVLEDALRRDVAVLSTLAHLHCTTVPQLHALCFPFHTLTTVRLTLRYLAEASFITHSTWRLKHETYERGQVWVLTAKGHDLLQRYAADVPPLARIDLARPSTALEHEEWRVRLQVRTLLARLLLEARQRPLLQCIEVQLPWSASWPTAWGQTPLPGPDAYMSITWHPPERKAADWLPWLEVASPQDNVIRHPIYLERTHARTNLVEMLPVWSQTTPDHHVPIVIFQDEDRCVPTLQQLHALPQVPAVRLASWTAMDVGLAHAQLRDEYGVACGLRPVHDLQVS